MPHWPPHLSTPDSIIEILWDIALLTFAIRLALIYALLTIVSTTTLLLSLTTLPFFFSQHTPSPQTQTQTTYPNLHPTPPCPPAHGGHPHPLPFFSSSLVTNNPNALPLLTLAAAAVSARVVIRRYDIPRVLVFRLAVGVGAGAVAGLVWLVMMCEVLGSVGRRLAWLMGGGSGFGSGDGGGGGVGGEWKKGMGVLGGVALMPAAMMGWEIAGEKVVGLFGWRRRGKGEDKER